MNQFYQKAQEVAHQFEQLAQVTAIALAGSQAGGAADKESDIDLYVYTKTEIPLHHLESVIEKTGGATRSDLNLPYWGGVNVWVDALTGITIDCVYFNQTWMEEQVRRVMIACQPDLGYSTCFCRTVRQSHLLYDPDGWFAALQSLARQDYPETLRRNIIYHNHPVLRTIMTSYLHQIENAVQRGDIVSIQHRLTALLASYFDILFALNRVMHPGEKRLLTYAHKECALLPEDMDTDLDAILQAATSPGADIVQALNHLLDRLDECLGMAGFDVTSG